MESDLQQLKNLIQGDWSGQKFREHRVAGTAARQDQKTRVSLYASLSF